LFWWNGINYNPKIPFYKILLFVWGPSFYLYFRNKIIPEDSLTILSKLIHFGFFFFSLILLLILGNNSSNAKNLVVETSFEFLNNIWIKVIYFSAYFVLILTRYLQFRHNLIKRERNWLKALITFFFLLLLITAVRAELYRIHSYDVITRYLAAFVFSGFIIVSGILFFLFPEFVTGSATMAKSQNDDKDRKYKNSGLTEDMSETLKHKLTENMMDGKLYLNSTLNLNGLAEAMNTDRYSVSQVINQKYGKNFYEYINDFRIEECIRLIEQSHEKIALIDDLVYECGFNNRVSFYKAFKKRKGMTPSQFIKSFDSAQSIIS
ncbi:MAG: helix-turn-helix domain-containing protein, partial [Pricia sp.]